MSNVDMSNAEFLALPRREQAAIVKGETESVRKRYTLIREICVRILDDPFLPEDSRLLAEERKAEADFYLQVVDLAATVADQILAEAAAEDEATKAEDAAIERAKTL